MLEEDRWKRWLRRLPLFRKYVLWDIDQVFTEMEEMMQREFSEFTKRAPRSLVRERKLSDGSTVREWGPFVYGYSLTVSPEGKPQLREFGNIRTGARLGKPHIDIKEMRDPLVDVIAADDEVEIVMELPGVIKEDIKLHVTEDSLTISVDSPQRKYRKKLRLPVKVDPKKAKSTYKNGVLEIIIVSKKREPTGESMGVE